MESTLIDKHMASLYARRSGVPARRDGAAPRQRPIIVTCSSPWVDPAAIFGLEPGEAYVIRSAGNIATQETVRSIMLAMVVDQISDIIVLGHTNCTIARKELFYPRIGNFFAKLPQQSYYKELFSTREKALKYLGIVDDVVANVRVQVENLKYLRNIQPGLNVTGMLYNVQNGHVYTLAEIEQVQAVLARDPKKDANSLVPTRYTAFARTRQVSAEPATQPRDDGRAAPGAKPLASEGDKLSTEAKDANKAEAGAAAPKPVADVPDEFAGQQLAFEKLMESMQRSIAKASRVRIFMPRIRTPRVRGIQAEVDQPDQPA
ncbi:MAG: carbonic anhydrase [Candidatus Lokiarchaeota archaeon]|nr:carbonic anhydrase [Candidatus Lokiarchaeota archaeon]